VSKNDKTTAMTYIGGTFNSLPFNSAEFNGSLVLCYVDGRPEDIMALADRIMMKWNEFLTENGL
jgi:hypothetical protein